MKDVTAKEVKKSFEEVKALKGVDLEIEEGEIVGVLGPNGAGKSTLIEILTGQQERDSGTVNVLGLDPEESPVELREKVGILPEREDPPSFLTGSEYLDFISETREVEIEKTEWIERLKLEGKMDSLTRDLSKGERQKLMLIQAFFHEPELVFIDEPLINLDPIIQEEAKKMFREFSEDSTILLCTHVVSLAEELCDRVLFLKDGKIIEVVDEVENLKQKFLEKE